MNEITAPLGLGGVCHLGCCNCLATIRACAARQREGIYINVPLHPIEAERTDGQTNVWKGA